MLWDGAQGRDKMPEFMAYMTLAASFAAIRTNTSLSVPTHLLLDLCARPEHIEPLRQEIESVLVDEGSVTKAALKNWSNSTASQRLNRSHSVRCLIQMNPKSTNFPLNFFLLLLLLPVLTAGRFLYWPLQNHLIHGKLTLHDGIMIAGNRSAFPPTPLPSIPNPNRLSSQAFPSFLIFSYFSSSTTASSGLGQYQQQQQQLVCHHRPPKEHHQCRHNFVRTNAMEPELEIRQTRLLRPLLGPAHEIFFKKNQKLYRPTFYLLFDFRFGKKRA